METQKFKLEGSGGKNSAREVGRIEVGRYVRMYDLSGETPRLVFELRERPTSVEPIEGPVSEEHISAVIDFFEQLAREEVKDGK